MYGLIKPGAEPGAKIEQLYGVPTLEDLQEHVGGLIDCQCLGPLSGGRTLDLYFNDEGLLHQMKACVWIEHLNTVIVGPVVLVATNREGATVSLQPDDLADVHFAEQHLISFEHCAMVPALVVPQPAEVEA